MNIGDKVLVEHDNGNILSFATVIELDDTMVRVHHTSGMLEGYTRWYELTEVYPALSNKG